MHAYPLNRHFWDAQVESLGKEGYRVIAPDLSGYGESAPLNENEVSMSGYVKHLFILLDHLKIKKAVFAGCSMGGYIMFEIWRTYPNRVKVIFPFSFFQISFRIDHLNEKGINFLWITL